MSLIARLLTNREVCLRCVSRAAEVHEDAAQAVVEALAASVLVIEAVALCRCCEELKKTFRMPTRY
jgi:hypothetical protein